MIFVYKYQHDIATCVNQLYRGSTILCTIRVISTSPVLDLSYNELGDIAGQIIGPAIGQYVMSYFLLFYCPMNVNGFYNELQLSIVVTF